MTPTAIPDHQAPNKLCRACQSKIPLLATKCIKCGSHQNWERYLIFSSSVLSLLVALVSVLSFAIPAWKKALTPSAPSASVAYVGMTDESLHITLSNTGELPIIITDTYIRIDDVGIRMDISPDDGRIVVQSGNVKELLVRFYKNKGQISTISRNTLLNVVDNKSDCKLSIGYVDAFNKRSVSEMNIGDAQCYVFSVRTLQAEGSLAMKAR